MARAAHVCPRPDCPNFMPCAEHARPNATARGYGHEHRKLRARWAPRVATGRVTCWRCGALISRIEAWDLGHGDDRSITRGPEHLVCNRSAAGKAAHDRY